MYRKQRNVTIFKISEAIKRKYEEFQVSGIYSFTKSKMHIKCQIDIIYVFEVIEILFPVQI